MNTTAIDNIKSKLLIIPDNYYNDVIEYLDFLNYKSEFNNHRFELTEEQIEILDQRSKTPRDQYISSDQLMSNLRNKFGV
jgi:hypothetical protein